MSGIAQFLYLIGISVLLSAPDNRTTAIMVAIRTRNVLEISIGYVVKDTTAKVVKTRRYFYRVSKKQPPVHSHIWPISTIFDTEYIEITSDTEVIDLPTSHT